MKMSFFFLFVNFIDFVKLFVWNGVSFDMGEGILQSIDRDSPV